MSPLFCEMSVDDSDVHVSSMADSDRSHVSSVAREETPRCTPYIYIQEYTHIFAHTYIYVRTHTYTQDPHGEKVTAECDSGMHFFL